MSNQLFPMKNESWKRYYHKVLDKKSDNLEFDISTEWTLMLSKYSPILYFWHKKGKKIKLRTFEGHKESFYFIDELIGEEIKKPYPTFEYSKNDKEIFKHSFNPKEYWQDWSPPPYQEHFSKKSKLNPSKDVIVVNNKYIIEKNRRPYNYLSLDFLENFLNKFHQKYQIYYIRYRGHVNNHDSYSDHDLQPPLEYGDFQLIDNYESVVTNEDVMRDYDIGFNLAQMWMHSHAKHSVCAGGGGAVLASYFGKDVVIRIHPNWKQDNWGMWQTNSWLQMLGCEKIIGTQCDDELIKICEDRWLD